MTGIVETCFARAGLLGNPSDGFGGRTISLALGNWRAVATLEPSSGVCLRLGNARSSWNSLREMHESAVGNGYAGPCGIVAATIDHFLEFFRLPENQPARGLDLQVESNIPLQVGLAGSSAIVIAVFRSLMRCYSCKISPEILASLALQVETDRLKIPAGLQDRVAQSLEGLVAMDFSSGAMRTVEGLRVGSYLRLDPGLLPAGLFVAWSRRGSEGTEVVHNDLKKRFAAGDSEVVAAMQQFAQIAADGVVALETRDHARLFELINANFDLRRSICQLNPVHLEMVETARQAGASAKYCGSGGAIIGTVAGNDGLMPLTAALEKIGCEVVRPIVAGPRDSGF